MQYDQAADGSRAPLPRTGVDTGMGFERIGGDQAGRVQQLRDRSVRARSSTGSSRCWATRTPSGGSTRRAIGCWRDHGRAMAFLIADGVLPGNDGRNYVLRLIMRRAMRFGRLMGFEGPFLDRADRGGGRPHGRRLPGVGRTVGLDPRGGARGGGPLRAHARGRDRPSWTTLIGAGPGGRRRGHPGRRGLPAVRHLRLPAGPDAGRGRGARPGHRPGRLRGRHGGAARAGTGGWPASA